MVPSPPCQDPLQVPPPFRYTSPFFSSLVTSSSSTQATDSSLHSQLYQGLTEASKGLISPGQHRHNCYSPNLTFKGRKKRATTPRNLPPQKGIRFPYLEHEARPPCPENMKVSGWTVLNGFAFQNTRGTEQCHKAVTRDSIANADTCPSPWGPMKKCPYMGSCMPTLLLKTHLRQHRRSLLAEAYKHDTQRIHHHNF